MWNLFEFLVGVWHGTGTGQAGDGTFERSYEFILNKQFLFVRNKSTYLPQPKNPAGEVHEDWGLISYDKARKAFVLRQFHVEGFVNQYVLDSVAADSRAFTFVSESIENISPGWRAKESYSILAPDEFIESFELAAPGKEFELYSQCHLKKSLS